MGGAGSSVKLAVRTLVEGIFQSREEHLETDPRPTARTQRSKAGRHCSQFRRKRRRSPRTTLRASLAWLPRQRPTRKSKAKKGKIRPVWILWELVPVLGRMVFSFNCIYRNRLSTPFPSCSLVSVGSRCLFAGHVLVVSVTCCVATSIAVFGGCRQVVCACRNRPSGEVHASQREPQKKRAARRLSSSLATSAAVYVRYLRTS